MNKIFIDGSSGTTGLRLYDRLKTRNDVELIVLNENERKNIDSRINALNNADIAFLCLPDAASKEIVELTKGTDTVIIDTSTAHRTQDTFAYGFPELSGVHKNQIKNSKYIAVPGCHASGFISVVYPLIYNKIVSADYPFVCYSVTGYSGGGKKMIAEYQDENRISELDTPRQYGLTQNHKHLKEMKAICGLTFEPVFSPIVSDFYSGMVVTVPIISRLLGEKHTAKQIHEMYCEHYKNQKLVTVAPFGTDGFIGADKLSGKDSMEIIVTGNDDRILICSRFDNLGKGSSGAAVQCMNIVTGNDEMKGLIL